MAQAQRQKLAFKDKDAEWKIGNLDYYYDRCRPYNTYFASLYKAANGEMDISDYNYFTNPLGAAVANRPELQSYPAKIRNVPIIPDIFNKLIGEKRDRPFIKQVMVTNPDIINKKRFEEIQFLQQNLNQIYINTLEELGMDTGQEAKPVAPLDEIMKQFSDNWSDSRAITGQETLNYISDNLDLPERFIDGFKHWVITGCVYSIKDVVGEDIVYEIIDPQFVGFIKDDSCKYIEDAEAAMVIRRFTRAGFMDRYSEMILNSDDYNDIVEYLDNPNKGSTDRAYVYDTNSFSNSYSGNENYRYTRDGNFTWLGDTVEVGYINWTSEEQVKVISITNELGEVDEIEVDEDYVINKELGEALVTTYWRTQKWEGYTVDKNKFYFGTRPIPVQRNLINRKSSGKNLINGRIKTLGNRKQISPVELLMPFQHLYNISFYKLMNTFAKNKEKLLIMPIGLLPKHNGWDMYTSMYHAEATGIFWLDESNPSSQAALNAIKSVDMSLGNIIAETLSLLREIKAGANDIVGMSPQRKGQVGNRDGANTTMIAQAQSYQISEDMFAEYEKFQEIELNALLDISKVAYINGKKASYINSEGRMALLNLEAGLGDFAYAELGVRVKSSSAEKRKMEKMEAYAETLASQKTQASTLATIIQTDNFQELVTKLTNIETKEAEMQQANVQAQQAHEKELADKVDAREQAKLSLEYYKVDSNNDAKKEVELIKADTAMMGMDLNKNGIADSIEITNQSLARDKQFFEQSMAERKILMDNDKQVHTKNVEHRKLKLEEEKIKQGKDKLDMEKYKVDTQYKIAKENKGKFDKK